MKSNFKVGDKVVIIDTVETDRTNQEGVIVDIDNHTTWHIEVKFEHDTYDKYTEWFHYSHLKHNKNHIVKQIILDL